MKDSWTSIRDSVAQVEDPISGQVDLEVYEEMYGPILETLDGLGEDSKVSFFFEVSRLNSSVLVFRNETARQFFREEAEELSLIPKLVEICEGETQGEKMRRTQSAPTLGGKPKPKVKRVQSADQIHAARESAARARLEELQKQLSTDGGPPNEKVQKKIARIQDMLSGDQKRLAAPDC